MKMAEIMVSGVEARAVELERIPAGIIGATVGFDFVDPMWGGMTKTVVFWGNEKRDVLNAGETVTIPAECVARPGPSLRVGVYGVDSQGNATPTLWADLGRIRAAADPSGDESTDPALPVWAQLQEQIDEIRQQGGGPGTPGKDGKDGGYYVPAVTQPDDNTIQFDFEPSQAGMPDVKPAQVKLPAGPSSGGNVALTADQISALDGMFKVCAFVKADISAEYNAFKTAFGVGGVVDPDEPNIPDEPDTPEKTLTSISVTYTGGEVYVGAQLTDLSGITVTAHYSDGSTAKVTGYTLSGEILEGSNTITVFYGGKTATFTVTAFVHDDEEPGGNDAPFDSIAWTDGLRITSAGKEYPNQQQYSTSDYADVSTLNTITISTAEDTPSGNIKYTVVYYGSDKTVIPDVGAESYINANNTSYPNAVTLDVPEGAMYTRICGTVLSGIAFHEVVVITVS